MRAPNSLRRVTDPLLERIPVPIWGGVNRGLWWSLVSAGSGYGTGRRGQIQMRVLERLIAPGDVVWDVGAHHGYVTLAAARLVGPTGCVHAFEPVARNRRILRRHLAWNRIRNTVVHPCALSSFDGEATFGGGGTSKRRSLGSGVDRVPVRTAMSLVDSGECRQPTFMKIDVEGAEGDVIDGARRVLPPHARLLIAVHSAEADRHCCSVLDDLDFDLHPSRGLRTARQGPWRGDPDLLGAGPATPWVEWLRETVRETGFQASA